MFQRTDNSIKLLSAYSPKSRNGKYAKNIAFIYSTRFATSFQAMLIEIYEESEVVRKNREAYEEEKRSKNDYVKNAEFDIMKKLMRL